MAFIIVPKPKLIDFLKRQQGDYLLLENGGKIVITYGWKKVAKPS